MKIILDRDTIARVLTNHVRDNSAAVNLFGTHGEWYLDTLSKEQAVIAFEPLSHVEVTSDTQQEPLSGDDEEGPEPEDEGEAPHRSRGERKGVNPIEAKEGLKAKIKKNQVFNDVVTDDGEVIPDATPLAGMAGASANL